MSMHPVRQRKLMKILLLMLVLASVMALVLYALRQNISLFYTPSEAANGKAPHHHAIRMGGMVVEKSIKRSERDLSVLFTITDYQNQVEVEFNGILPDLFREGQGVVAKGQLLDNRHFKAVEVLAKHDEKYMPPEVKEALERHNKAKS